MHHKKGFFMKVYADAKYTKYLTKLVKHYYKEQEPHVEQIVGGIIANEHDMGYGVFDKNWKFVKSSTQNHKGRKGQFVPHFNHDNIPYIDEDVIYLCHLGKNNFGHFILEHLNRGWCLIDKNYQDMKVAIIDEIGAGKINDYIYVLLGLLGVKKNNIILLDKTTRFKNVFIPTPAFDLSAYWSDAYRNMWKYIADNVSDTDVYEKIYLSRCKMPMDRHTYGEETIQKIFEKNGYQIIYPETLPLTEQFSLIKNCKYLAGCAGTALHLALAMKQGGTVIQIKRNTPLQDNADTQSVINMTRGLNSVFVAGSMETVKTDHWSLTPQIIGMTDYMKQFFDENGFKYNKSDLKNWDKEFADYNVALSKCDMQKYATKSVKKYIIKYLSCFCIGRVRRNKFREFLKKLLKYEY